MENWRRGDLEQDVLQGEHLCRCWAGGTGEGLASEVRGAEKTKLFLMHLFSCHWDNCNTMDPRNSAHTSGGSFSCHIFATFILLRVIGT